MFLLTLLANRLVAARHAECIDSKPITCRTSQLDWDFVHRERTYEDHVSIAICSYLDLTYAATSIAAAESVAAMAVKS